MCKELKLLIINLIYRQNFLFLDCASNSRQCQWLLCTSYAAWSTASSHV